MLRASGYTAAPVETWGPVANVRRDLFGVADVLAVRPATRDTTRRDVAFERFERWIPSPAGASYEFRDQGWYLKVSSRPVRQRRGGRQADRQPSPRIPST